MRTQPKDVLTLLLCALFQPQPPPYHLRAPLWRDASYGTACSGPEWCCYKEGEHTSLLIFLSVTDQSKVRTQRDTDRTLVCCLILKFCRGRLSHLGMITRAPWKFWELPNTASYLLSSTNSFGLPGISVLIVKAIQGIGLCFLRYHVSFHQHDLLWHLTATIWTVNRHGKFVSVCNELLTAILHYLLLSFLRDLDLNIFKNKCAPPLWHTCLPQKLQGRPGDSQSHPLVHKTINRTNANLTGHLKNYRRYCLGDREQNYLCYFIYISKYLAVTQLLW